MTISQKNSERAAQLISILGLAPHPEGGFFKETYRAKKNIKTLGLPGRYDGERSFCTGIYFLLRGQDFSAFHKVNSDEMWHFYEGSPVVIYHIEGEQLIKTIVGPVGEGVPQFVVPGGCWFAAEPLDKNSYTLVGCTVSPGFDFNDFELAERKVLAREWPQFKSVIDRLSHEGSLEK